MNSKTIKSLNFKSVDLLDGIIDVSCLNYLNLEFCGDSKNSTSILDQFETNTEYFITTQINNKNLYIIGSVH